MDEVSGRLILSIGRGSFRDQVAKEVSALLERGYALGASR